MVDIQRTAPVFKWVCISLFVLLILFYFRGYELTLGSSDFGNYVLLGEDYSISSISYDREIGKPHIKNAVRPLKNLCYFLVYKTVGHQQLYIVLHILSQLIHLAVSVCVFLFMKRLTANTLVGISSAILFASFHTNVHSVLYFNNSDDQMLCMFGLLSIISYIRHLDGKGPYNYLLSLIFLCLAFLSKENGVTLFAIILLIDIYLRKETVEKGGPWRNGLDMRGIKTCLPLFLLSILYVLFISFYCETTGEKGQMIDNIKTSRWLGGLFFISRDFFNFSVSPIHVDSLGIRLIIALSIAAIYIISDKGVKRLVQLLGLCCLILLLPPAVLLPAGLDPAYVYLPSVFTIGLIACVINQGAEKLSGLSVVALPMALLACTVGYVVEKLLAPRIVDFKDPRAVFFALLLLAHSSIILINYDFVQGEIKKEAFYQRERNWLAKPVGDFLSQKEGYRHKAVYLLNFPHINRLVYGRGWFAEENKRMIAYSCGLDLKALDDMDAPPGKLVLNRIALGKFRHFAPYVEQPEISAEEFDRLAKDPNNKIILLDQVTEQIIDVSETDFNRVRDLMSDKEKQKAFVLR